MQALYKFIQFIVIILSRFFQLPMLVLKHIDTLSGKMLHSCLGRINNINVFRSSLRITGLVISILYFGSCQKVINVDLNTADKRFVVEAELTDQANSCKVLLTETRGFNENNAFPGVSGAVVSITDDNGVPVSLSETSAGIYESRSLKGVSGHIYNLTIKIAGQTFAANAAMPALVPIDSIYITERNFFNESRKYATLAYKDPLGRGNAYRFLQYVNGIKEKTIFVRDDDLTDGRPIERILFFFYEDDEEEEKMKLKKGDVVRVEMLGIDYPVYKYWYSLSQSSTGENQSATPGNPVTNIKGGALGYFSAHTIQSKTVTVP